MENFAAKGFRPKGLKGRKTAHFVKCNVLIILDRKISQVIHDVELSIRHKRGFENEASLCVREISHRMTKPYKESIFAY